MKEFRKHAAWYTKGLPGAARLRRSATTICKFDDLRAFLILCWKAQGKDDIIFHIKNEENRMVVVDTVLEKRRYSSFFLAGQP